MGAKCSPVDELLLAQRQQLEVADGLDMTTLEGRAAKRPRRTASDRKLAKFTESVEKVLNSLSSDFFDREVSMNFIPLNG